MKGIELFEGRLMEDRWEQKPPSSNMLWSRGILGGIVAFILIGGCFLLLDSEYPLRNQFSAEGVIIAAFILAFLGFVVSEFDSRANEIDFTGRWAHLLASGIVGFYFWVASSYVGFTVLLCGASVVFGSWLKMVSIEDKRPKRHF